MTDSIPTAVDNRTADNLASDADTALALSDLDLALADWARRHGADALVARAFALASRAVTQGHSCLALDAIPAALMATANQRQLSARLAASTLVGDATEKRPLVLDGQYLYLQRYHAYETRLAARLRELLSAPPTAVDIDQLRPGAGLFSANPQHPDATNWQAVAAFTALRHRFTVISGGPGTGKTYTIVRLLRVLIETALTAHQPPPHIALAAPTGKAAARMVDSIRNGLAAMATEPTFDPAIEQHVPQTAHTLHRLLGLGRHSTKPRFNADNPLPANVVIIDEASMVDLPMMAKLADAIRSDTRLILLGDRYQLASVESGAVLADICAHAGVNQFSSQQQAAAKSLLAAPATPSAHPLADHVVTLQTSRRFNATSAIGRFAAAVNAGDVDTVHQLFATDHADLSHAEVDAATIRRLLARLAEHYTALIDSVDPAEALDSLSRHCILTAVRNGATGSNAINTGLVQQLAQRHQFDPNQAWYHGRPVMVTRNDYRVGLFNGDIGIALRNDIGDMRIWFHGDDEPRSFLPSALPAHDTAYAMTIHKSQGSEFGTVSLVLPDYDVPVLTRELIYTGATRAHGKLAIYARQSILDQAIQRRVSRHSQLASRLATAD